MEQGVDVVRTMSYYYRMRIFKWDAEKNEVLARERGVTFEEIVERIGSGATVVETGHPNREKYPHQRLLIVDLEGYAYVVPFVQDGDTCFLKTIIPSRKATKKYLGEENEA